MDYIFLVFGSSLILLGLIGCVLPVLPGPPLSFLALIMLQITRWGDFSTTFLIIMALLAIVVTALDYIVPAWGTKKFGGSKRGTWGATIGLVIGMFCGPACIIFFPFVGAFIGEYTGTQQTDQALQAAVGSFIGILTGIILKLIISGLITYYFIIELIN